MASPVRTPASRRPASAPQTQIAKRGASADSSAIPVVLAPLERRVAGAAIDLALLLLASGIVAAMLERATSGVTRVRIDAVSGQRTVDAATSLPTWLPLALLVAFTAAYTITLMSLWGRTLGGWAVGIRCIRADSGTPPGWRLSTRRWFVLYGAAGILAFAPIIGPFSWILTLVVGLSPLWDGTNRLRGYADHLGGDIVVMARHASKG